MNGRLVEVTQLTAFERDAMFALLSDYFDGVSREQFEKDLFEKDWAVLIEDERRLVGLSTLRTYSADVSGEQVIVVYSGDTIVAPSAWGSAVFPRVWIHSVYQLRERFENRRFLWMLLTSGFRTYRFLPVFWREFYPRFDAPTPLHWQQLLDDLATRQFGGQFDRATGIVRFARPQRLRGPLAEVAASRRIDPHVAFFLQKNPGHREGDELVCVTDLSPENLTAAGRRVTYGAAR